MSRRIRSMVLAATVATLSLGGLSGAASASYYGVYVCEVALYGTPEGYTFYGEGGLVLAYLYTDPGCTNLAGTYFFCSKGAVSGSCTDYPLGQRNDVQLMELHRALTQAMHEGTPVDAFGTSCHGSGTDCGYAVRFRQP